ncbi:hypothetical protein [Acidithiobacillus sulfuriphilus]|uniref:hypothetical protein n=1 Tax=Acidithiobacillus sulfuriphilus TaxID=1867749 RepID=UPI003F5F77D2
MIYEVWCPENGTTNESAVEIEAVDPYSAAEKWAALEDECDVGIAEDERTVTVCVRKSGTSKVLEIFVTGEMLRCYSARLKVEGVERERFFS